MKSEGPAYTGDLHARDLAEFIREREAAPAHLVASSFEAYIALLMAVGNPALARSLVLGEPPILPWLADIPGGRPLLDSFMSQAWEPARRAFENGDREAGVMHFLRGVMGPRVTLEAGRSLMDNAPELARRMPRARLIVIPASSHSMQTSNSPACNRTVLQFLAEQPPLINGQAVVH